MEWPALVGQPGAKMDGCPALLSPVRFSSALRGAPKFSSVQFGRKRMRRLRAPAAAARLASPKLGRRALPLCKY